MVLGRGLQASRERRSMNHLLARNRLSAGRHIPEICIICIFWDCLYFLILLVIGRLAGTYRVVFLTGPPDFQYQNEKTCSANEELFYIENFVKN